MPQGEASKPQSLRYKVALIFSLTSLLPLLLFVHILDRKSLLQDPEAAWTVVMCMMIALIGFAFFLKTIQQINARVSGVLYMEPGTFSEEPGVTGPTEIAAAAHIADGFSRLLKDLQTNSSELEGLVLKLSTLSEVTDLASHVPDIKDVLQIVLLRAMEAVGSDIGSIMLLDEATQTLRIAAEEGLNDAIVAETTMRVGEGVAGKVAQTGEPVLVNDVEQDARFKKGNNPKYSSSSFICLPLRAQKRIIGVINMSKRGNEDAAEEAGKRVFSEADLKFLSTLLGHIGIAVENARLLKDAKDSALELQRVIYEEDSHLDHVQQQLQDTDQYTHPRHILSYIGQELQAPLATAMGYSQLLLSTATDRKSRQLSKQVFSDVRRANRIIRNLLDFADQEPPNKQRANLNDILTKVLGVKSQDFVVSQVEVSADFATDLPPVMADAEQLQQALLHILSNARQEMVQQDSPRRLGVRTFQKGEHVLIEIADTGPGIAPENVEKLFAPFFSTKEQGKGLGLGLSIAQDIMQAHAGDLSVDTQLGEGTTFLFALPVAMPAATSETDDVSVDLEDVPALHVAIRQAVSMHQTAEIPLDEATREQLAGLRSAVMDQTAEISLRD